MPSVSSGIRAVVTVALLAASGPATPSIAPLVPNSARFWPFASFFSVGVAQEGRNLGAAGRDAPERRADRGAAQPGGNGALPVAAGHVDLAQAVLGFRHPSLVQGCVQHLGHREQADRNQHDLDAVEQFGHAQGVAGLAGNLVHAHQSHGQAEEQGRHAAQGALAQHRTDGGEGQHHQQEILGRPELDGEFGHIGREQRDDHGGDGSGHERADGRGRQGGAGAPALGHLVAFHRGDHARGFARRVQQDRGGRAAVHRTVVDAGEEDHRGGDVHLGRDRQQHRHRHRRSDAGQHADGGAEPTADQAPEQVGRRNRRGETLQESVDDVHAQSHPVAVRPGRLIARNWVKVQNTGAEIASPVTRSIASVRGCPMRWPAALRSPCTASR